MTSPSKRSIDEGVKFREDSIMKLLQQAVLGLVSLLSISPSLFAQQSSVRSGSSRLTGALVLLDTTYEANDSVRVEGDLLSFAYKAAVNPQFSLGAGLGILLDGDLRSDNGKITKGEGLNFFVEGSYAFMHSGANEFQGTFGLSHNRYDFGNNTKWELRSTELKLGGLFSHRIDPVTLYGGLDVFLLSKGDLSVGNFQTDIERDNRVGIRLGLSFAATGNIDLRGELDLLGQQSLILGVDAKI